MKTDRELARIAERSHGLLSDEQWATIGLSQDQRHRWARSGRISVPEPGVIRIRGSVSAWHQRVLAAVLTEDGFASHRTAAALWRLEGFDPRLIEVTTPRWKRRPNDSVKVHENKHMTAADVTTRAGIPCTAIEWTPIHLGAVVPAVLVEVGLDDALRRGLTTPEKIWAVFLRVARKGVNGVGVIRPMLVRRPRRPRVHRRSRAPRAGRGRDDVLARVRTGWPPSGG